MVDAVGATAYSYTSGGQLWTEDGPFASDTVTNSYSNRSRVGLSLQQPTGVWTNGFGYDVTRRLVSVTSPAGAFGYGFSVNGATLPGSLLRGVSLPNSAYITNTYDAEAHLTGTWLKKSDGTVLDAATYGYNAGNQRTTFTNAAGTRLAYTYDNIGQLKVADSSVNTEDRGYLYYAAWNLNRLTNNGATSAFSVDSLNQLLSAPVGTCSYDSNGNLVRVTGNGITAYFYDDENRLVAITNGPNSPQISSPDSGPLSPTPTGGWKTEFTYDGKSRLRIRKEYYAHSTGYYLTNTTWYIYDGNRVIQERDGSNVPTVSYTRGTDLSGTLEGAGGIGGLLARSHGYSSGNWTTHNFYHADGNGNITALVDSTQALAASYRYDPFGNLISKSGSLADANVYRFSSKEFHVNSGLYYYLYRFYSPGLQRWVNRDPAGEDGGANLYTFAQSSPQCFVDPDGQTPISIPIRWPFPITLPEGVPISVPGPWLLLCGTTQSKIDKIVKKHFRSCNAQERKACAADCGGYKYIFMCTVEFEVVKCRCRTIPHPGDPYPKPPSWP